MGIDNIKWLLEGCSFATLATDLGCDLFLLFHTMYLLHKIWKQKSAFDREQKSIFHKLATRMSIKKIFNIKNSNFGNSLT